jgi:hypothetical protein
MELWAFCRVLNCIYIHLAGNTSEKIKVLGIHFNLYKEDKDVCKAKTVLVPYRKIQYVAIETPFFIVIILIIKVLLILSSGFPSHKN